MKVQVTDVDVLAGRPLFVGLPLVRAGLKHQRLGQIKSSLVLQPVGEPRRLDLFAEAESVSQGSDMAFAAGNTALWFDSYEAYVALDRAIRNQVS